jgi:hypothetical protein
MKFKLLALAVSVAAMTSCEQLFNEDVTSPDGSSPLITINTPYDNTVYSTSQAIRIQSEISDKDKISQLDVKVTKLDGSNQVWGFTKFPMKNPVILDTAFSAAGLAAGNYVLTLNTIDGRTNVGTKEIKFTVK